MATKKRPRQRNVRYKDPGVTPIGSPRPVGIGTVAKIAKETRQIRRARERQEAA